MFGCDTMAIIYCMTIKATAYDTNSLYHLHLITDHCKKVTRTYQLLYKLQKMITSVFKNASQYKFLYIFYMLMTLWPVLGAARCHELCNTIINDVFMVNSSHFYRPALKEF